MFSRRLALAVLTCAAVLPLVGCKVVRIADQEAEAPAGFNAAAYADGIWVSEALPFFAQSADPVVAVMPAIAAGLADAGVQFGYRPGEGSPWSFVVSGQGTVIAKNTESRAGTLEVSVDGVADPVVLQIGPVIRGNAVRDALPFVGFKDFTNQIEYANAGKALTALAVAGFEGSAAAIAVGDEVAFTGSISMASASDRPLVTPITLEKVAP